jgi:ectoine hydroxylase-related dioxygenase (phytanoyl-CoA dioxygenase family)
MLSKNSVLKNIENLTFHKKNFIKYDFWHAKLKNIKFIDCNFNNCIFSDTIFNNTVLENCEISNCNFQHASISNSKFQIKRFRNNLIDDIKVDKKSKLSNFKLKNKIYKPKIIKSNSLNKKEKSILKALTTGPGYIVLKKYYKKKSITKAYNLIEKIVEKDKKIKSNSKVFERNKKLNQKWVRSLLNLNPIFQHLILPKIVDKVFSRLLGEDYICGSYSANCLLPGARGQNSHVDYPYWKFVAPGKIFPYKNLKNFNLNLQVATPLTEFTKNNGSTAIIENSHKKMKYPDYNDLKKAKIKIVKMKPGSILIYNGLLWHGSTPNFSQNKKRYAIISQYMPSYIVPTENLKKMTSKNILKKNKLLKRLLGYNLKFPIKY